MHGWAGWRVFQMDRKRRRQTNPNDPGELAFLERVFHKLMLNFTWWVNRLAGLVAKLLTTQRSHAPEDDTEEIDVLTVEV